MLSMKRALFARPRSRSPGGPAPMSIAWQVCDDAIRSHENIGPAIVEDVRIGVEHGLLGRAIALPETDAELAARRREEWDSSLRPFNAFDCWLADLVAVESIRIDRCRREEVAIRAEQSRRAGLCWDQDRRLAAETLAAKLGKGPALASRQLQQTSQGCDCLIERWKGLERALGDLGDWTEAQRALALDLLGVPLELREGMTAIDVLNGGDAHAVRLAVARAEIERLTRWKAQVGDRLDSS